MKRGTVIWALIVGGCSLAATIWAASHYGAFPSSREATLIELKKSDFDKLRPPVSSDPPYPAVVLENGTTHKFGLMKLGDSGTHTFRIRNNGEAPLVLWKGRTSCKCTMSEFGGQPVEDVKDEEEESQPETKGSDISSETPKKPVELVVDIGKTAEIKLTWKTEDMGPFEQGAMIYTNDPQNRDVKLIISGMVERTIVLVPSEVWSLGDVPEHETAEASGTVYSKIVDSFEIADIQTSNALLKCEAVPLSSDELANRGFKSGYNLKVTLSPGIRVGQFKESVTFNARTKSDDVKLNIAVKGFRTGPFRILPVAGVKWHPQYWLLELGTFSAQEHKSFSLPFFVTESGGENFQVQSIDSDVPSLQARMEAVPADAAESKQQYRLILEFSPGPARNHTRPPYGQVHVKTNHPNAAELTLFLKFLSL
jgi:hypothetical protein